jgi:hypothetical protein
LLRKAIEPFGWVTAIRHDSVSQRPRPDIPKRTRINSTMSMSDTSTSRSSSKPEAAAIQEAPPSPRRVRRQSKLTGMIARGMGMQSTGASSLNNHSNHHRSADNTSKKTVVTNNNTNRPLLENQESIRIQQEHATIMKKIEAATARARRDMDKIRKESLLKENKVRAEMEQLAKELTHIELDEAKRIKAVQEREANELEKLVRELKRI